LIKVILSKDIENKHKAYFKKCVLPKLIASKEIDVIPYDVKKAKIEYNGQKTKIEYENFIDYIVNEETKNNSFSIGSSDKLKELKDKIMREFPTIIDLLDESIVKKDTHNEIKLNEYILASFGYAKFTKVILFDFLREIACEKSGKTRYCDVVQSEIVNMLCRAFPEDKKRIEEQIPKTNLSADQFREKLKEINDIGITIYNFNHIPSTANSVWNAYSFVFESGLRVCPYCNRQYISPVLTSDGMMRADIDHILSKMKYPYFSMSLYNLVPSCQQCNQSLKGDKESVINPYEDNLNSYFEFMIDETGEIKTKNLDEDPKTEKYLEMFKIQLLYNYHKNQGVDLAKKRIAYPESYITELYQKNKDYFKDETIFRELIFGFFTTEEKINEEAFSKFRRDIARQLGIIGKDESTQLIEKLKKHLTKL